MTDKVAREMTFEEEAKLYKEETAEFLKSETVDSEPPFVNSILRRGNRIIRKASDRIERLQSENRRLKKSVDNQCDDCACEIADERDKLKEEVERLKAERDKAVEDLHGYCKVCKYQVIGLLEAPCRNCNRVVKQNFVWRGLEW